MTVLPALPQPCAECPWRNENHGRRHEHGFYTLTNRRRLWSGLRAGAQMTCHPTDPRMAEWDGYEETADRDRTHECCGGLILVTREVAKLSALARRFDEPRATFRLYRQLSGLAQPMTRHGLYAATMRFAIRGPAAAVLTGGIEPRTLSGDDLAAAVSIAGETFDPAAWPEAFQPATESAIVIADGRGEAPARDRRQTR